MGLETCVPLSFYCWLLLSAAPEALFSFIAYEYIMLVEDGMASAWIRLRRTVLDLLAPILLKAESRTDFLLHITM